jgi:hypothetical protein
LFGRSRVLRHAAFVAAALWRGVVVKAVVGAVAADIHRLTGLSR